MQDREPNDTPAAVQIAADLAPQAPSWLWPLWLGRGVLAMLDGDLDVGKSLVAVDLAARVSRGFTPPVGDGPRAAPAGVLLLSARDAPATVLRPRLEAAGADLARVAVRCGPAVLAREIDALRPVIDRLHVGLVVIDPLQAFLEPGQSLDNERHVRQTLEPLEGLAADTGACVLLVRRPGKATRGAALRRGDGSLAVLEACWTALVLGRDPGEPQRRVLAVTRSKAAPRPPSLRLALEPRGPAVALAWQGECVWTPDEAVAPVPLRHAEPLSRVEDCAEYVRALLRPGPLPSTRLNDMCHVAGFADITVERARKHLGVRAVRTGLTCWQVVLPDALPPCKAGPA
jgi:putative DNA primase/helicase